MFIKIAWLLGFLVKKAKKQKLFFYFAKKSSY